ncbi:MAG: guanylate kinase [Bacteroidetes bacterium]|nr:guanylate kinase [Bacteroidota bacterium]
MQGKLIVFSAPSGAGKTTIVHRLLNMGLPLEFSISACSRAKRPEEVDGKDYYFLTPEEFKHRIDNQEFLEWEEVYPGSFYGTLKSELTRIWGKGKHVIFDVDVVGGLNIKKLFPAETLAVFVLPPSIEELEARLKWRNTETPESLAKRLSKAQWELTFADKFDYQLLNDNLDRSTPEIYAVISSFIEK